MMGVSGSGKTTIAQALAGRLGWPFEEGDALHPPENIAKMSAGIPLGDADRWPWLDRVAAWIDGQLAAGRPGVVTCSALRRSYRDRLRRPGVLFAYLEVPGPELRRRVTERHGHFMPPELLDSQLALIQPPKASERAVLVDGLLSPDEQVEAIVHALG